MSRHNNTQLLRVTERLDKATGFSLMEMMISIVVGLVVVGGVISIFASAIKSHSDNLRMTRLNQELRTTMNLMTSELRRAGFWGRGGITATLGSPTTANRFDGIVISPARDCITFRYDADNDGNLIASENQGFRLNGDAVEMRSGNSLCSDSGWIDITDPNAIVITDLAFSLTPNATVDVDVDGMDGDVPCRPTSGCPPGIVSVPPTLQNVTVREIDITLTGRLAGDASVTRTIQETVRAYQ